jgi:hypothetical protein
MIDAWPERLGSQGLENKRKLYSNDKSQNPYPPIPDTVPCANFGALSERSRGFAEGRKDAAATDNRGEQEPALPLREDRDASSRNSEGPDGLAWA